MDFRTGYRRPLRTAALLRRKRQRTRLGMGIMAIVAVAVTACNWEPGAPPAGATAAAPTLHIALSTNAPAPASAARRIYPYSIVPGGVATRADLERRVSTDQVVARHYASFDIKKAHPVTVAKARAVHVSYRKGDKVYWTAGKVMLAQGETLLSDGSSEIRGRCGNRISDTAQLPVAMGEPTAAELDESMNVAPDPAEDGGLQNASFALDDPAPSGNPTLFQRFPGSGLTSDAAPVTPPARTGMPSVPMAAPDGMGLTPSRYLTIAAGPTVALGPSTVGSTTVTPATPADTTNSPPASTSDPVVPANPPVPAVPAVPSTPVIPVIPGAPVPPPTPAGDPKPPVKTPLPEGEVPEPGTLWLVGSAFALLLSMTRKKAGSA